MEGDDRGDSTMFGTLTSNSPWVLLAGSGANQGLGLSSQLCPMVCNMGRAAPKHGRVESNSSALVVVRGVPMVKDLGPYS